ncbi:unnamed protein product [Closterium sp. NIES-54]
MTGTEDSTTVSFFSRPGLPGRIGHGGNEEDWSVSNTIPHPDVVVWAKVRYALHQLLSSKLSPAVPSSSSQESQDSQHPQQQQQSQEAQQAPLRLAVLWLPDAGMPHATLNHVLGPLPRPSVLSYPQGAQQQNEGQRQQQQQQQKEASSGAADSADETLVLLHHPSWLNSPLYTYGDVGMVYCYVQKAGCTSWKFWLREQHHHPFPKSFLSAHTAHFTNVTAVWYSLTEPQAIRSLTRRDFTRFVFIRNPYTRVLSAYLDKMLRGGGPDDLGAGFWAQAFFGQLVTHSLWDVVTFRSGPGTARLRSIWEVIQLRTGFQITFDEFVDFLGEAWEIESRFHLDVHIVPQTLLCALDRIKYDFVGRFENMDEDVMALMRRFGREPGDAFSFGKKLQKTKSRGRLSDAFANKSMDEDVMTLIRQFGREPGDAFSFGKKLQKTKSRGRLSDAFANKLIPVVNPSTPQSTRATYLGPASLSLVACSGSVRLYRFQSLMEAGEAGKAKGHGVAGGGDGGGGDGGCKLGNGHAFSSTLPEMADVLPSHGMEHNNHQSLHNHKTVESIFEEPNSILGDTTTNANGHAGNINNCADYTNGHAGNTSGHADSSLLGGAYSGGKGSAACQGLASGQGLMVGGEIQGNLHGRESSCSCDEPAEQQQVEGGGAGVEGGAARGENCGGGYGLGRSDTLGGRGRGIGGGGGDTGRDGASSLGGGGEADDQRVLAQPPLHILHSVRPEPLNGYSEQGQEGPAGSMAPVIHGMLLAHPTAEKTQELEWDDLIGRIEAEIEKPQASSCVDIESSSIARQDSQIVTGSEGAVPPSDSAALKREAGKGKARRVVQRKRPANSTSKFRGVTHHCRTGRWEAHIWEEGRQVYLGGFDSEKQAALMYDIAALKMRGEDAQTNLPPEEYTKYTKEIEAVPKEELILLLRRHSKGFARGTSKYRGVTKHQKGRWEARIGHVEGKRYDYLGLFDTQEQAAMAYDRAAVR